MSKRKSIDMYHFKPSNHVFNSSKAKISVRERLLFITFKLNVRKQKIDLFWNETLWMGKNTIAYLQNSPRKRTFRRENMMARN